MVSTMKILHTSDWHLGRRLYGRTRYSEFTSFLDWLAACIEERNIDALLVSGDIFDTTTPGNRAQQLYYRFLNRVAGHGRCQVVVIGGNHDSPSFLNAPGQLLQVLNVHVRGAMTDNPADEIVVLSDSADKPAAIVCAVPYLRDRDIRVAEAGETLDDKTAKLIQGVRDHYITVCGLAEEMQQELGHLPIICMGHLFTTGSKTVAGDGVRELYVGSLAHVDEAAFPACIDYLALGHLHVPQQVGGSPHYRYCGSPIPMGFGEAEQQKEVVEIIFHGRKAEISTLPVPCFQHLLRLTGSLDEIYDRVAALKEQESTSWLEIVYTGQEIIGNLRELIEEAVSGSSMEIRRIHNRAVVAQALRPVVPDETLDDLDVDEVFSRCLDSHEVADEKRQELVDAYREIVLSLQEDDRNAE